MSAYQLAARGYGGSAIALAARGRLLVPNRGTVRRLSGQVVIVKRLASVTKSEPNKAIRAIISVRQISCQVSCNQVRAIASIPVKQATITIAVKAGNVS